MNNPTLTDREMEILILLGRGHNNIEIAKELVIQPHTVRSHLTNIYAKLHVNSRLSAILTAQAQGLIQSQQELDITPEFLIDLIETERAIRKLMRHLESQIETLLNSKGR